MNKTKTMPKVAIIIVNYNGKKLLQKHLPSVVSTRYPNFSIVLVDNGSEDGSVEWLRGNFSEMRVIKSEVNLGFARANNLAFEEVRDVDYFALLNNDVSVETDWLQRLVETAETDHRIAAVGPKLLYSNKRDDKHIINNAGGVVDKYDRGFDRGEGDIDKGQYDHVEEIESLCGGAVLLREKAVSDVDGFDNRMFFYYEDVDLSLRFREKGWKLMYNGKAVVYHDHMGTVGSWGSQKTTLHSNVNRIKSIFARRGMIAGVAESIRAPLEWLIYKILASFTGVSYRERILREVTLT